MRSRVVHCAEAAESLNVKLISYRVYVEGVGVA